MYDLVRADAEFDRRSLVNGVLFPERTGTTQFCYDGVDYIVKNGKLYNDKTEVAVVYSPGYGGDYSAYKSIDPTDARAAVVVLVKATGTIVGLIKDEPEAGIQFKPGKFSTYGNYFWDIAISWLPSGSLYRITEYDGFESVETPADNTWRIALWLWAFRARQTVPCSRQ